MDAPVLDKGSSEVGSLGALRNKEKVVCFDFYSLLLSSPVCSHLFFQSTFFSYLLKLLKYNTFGSEVFFPFFDMKYILPVSASSNLHFSFN